LEGGGRKPGSLYLLGGNEKTNEDCFGMTNRSIVFCYKQNVLC